MLGVWGTYMPLGAALGLLAGPVWIAAFGWRHWWATLAGASAAMALWLWRGVADAPARHARRRRRRRDGSRATDARRARGPGSSP